MYDISAIHKEKFTEQWWGEMIWWTKFTFLCPLGVDIEPLPLDMLKDRHSEIKVVEFHADKDPDAIKKFIEMTGKPQDSFLKHMRNTEEHDSTVVIVRNAFSLMSKDNMLRELNSKEGLRKHLRQDVNYTTLTFPNGGHYKATKKPLSEIIDHLEDTDTLTTITSDLTMLKTQPELFEHYENFWRDLGLEFNGDIVLDEHSYLTQTFLYYGNRYRTRVHCAGVTDHSLQLSNTKRWRIIHKRYMPYTGMIQLNTGGLKTPEYFMQDYNGKLPHTEFLVYPGDILYFSFWHPHEVTNVHPDQLGFALGVRRIAPKQRFWGEPVRAIAWFGMFNMPAQIKTSLSRKATYADQVGCKSYADRQFSFSYNGSSITRFDLKEINGKCVVAEREIGYQIKELNGDYTVDDWRPRHSMHME